MRGCCHSRDGGNPEICPLGILLTASYGDSVPRTLGPFSLSGQRKWTKRNPPPGLRPLRGFPRSPLASGGAHTGYPYPDAHARDPSLAPSGPTSSARLTRRDPRGLNVKTGRRMMAASRGLCVSVLFTKYQQIQCKAVDMSKFFDGIRPPRPFP